MQWWFRIIRYQVNQRVWVNQDALVESLGVVDLSQIHFWKENNF
jgi:hypothetical protein